MSRFHSHGHSFFQTVPQSEIVNWETLQNAVTPQSVSEQVCVWRGDITRLKISAIVAAANRELAGCMIPRHCIDAAIFSAAGPELFSACKPLAPCEIGQAKITPGFLLPSEYVIHTVGPQISSGGEVRKKDIDGLSKCYTSVLTIAKEKGIRSLAFCCISTGVFGFPKEKAAHIALSTTREFLLKNPTSFDLVVFNVFTNEDERIYRDIWEVYFSNAVHQLPQDLKPLLSSDSHCNCKNCLLSNGRTERTLLSKEDVESFEHDLLTSIKWIQEADSILICAGAGLSIFPGLNPYGSSSDFLKLYPGLLAEGYSTAYECMGLFYDPKVPVQKKWGYLLIHMYEQRYRHRPHQGYHDLLTLAKAKDKENDPGYFVLTSNVDGYFERVGFDSNRIYRPQGDWERYQCLKPCLSDSCWPTADLIQTYLPHVDRITTSVSKSISVPVCPSCGSTAFGNVRGGDWFLHGHLQEQQQRLVEWVDQQKLRQKKVVILEIGAGFNTPIITRFPMEAIYRDLLPNSAFIRINPSHPQVPSDFEKAVSLPLGWQVVPTILSSIEQGNLSIGNRKVSTDSEQVSDAERIVLEKRKRAKSESQTAQKGFSSSGNFRWKDILARLA